jgi:hypothetical protein
MFKTLTCECEILTNPYDIRRKDLVRMYGLGLGSVGGRREIEVV